MEDYELYYSAKTLSYLLHTHFGKKCIVLIDECDGPIQKAIFKSCTDLSKIIDFIREFISISLKSNTYVGRALINACIRLGGVITADANNIEHIPFLTDHIFSPFYGFTEEDVKLLLEKLNMSDKLVYVREWYDGYKVENSNISIYNPHSILNYLKSKECNSYWGKSGYVINIERILLKKELRIKMKTLLDNKVISISAADRITVNEILKLKELVNDVDNCTLGYRDIFLFLNFMLDLGYFTVTERKGLDLKLRIPNKEIRTEIKYHVYSMLYFKKKLNVTDKDIKRYVNSINTLGKSEDSYKEFAQSVLNLFSYGEMPKTKKELLKPLAAFPRFSKDFLEVKVNVLNVPIETNKTDKSGVI